MPWICCVCSSQECWHIRALLQKFYLIRGPPGLLRSNDKEDFGTEIHYPSERRGDSQNLEEGMDALQRQEGIKSTIGPGVRCTGRNAQPPVR